MTITYYTRTLYGTVRFYILDKEQAHNWYRLTGTETITEDQSEAAKELGIKFERVTDPKSTGL